MLFLCNVIVTRGTRLVHILSVVFLNREVVTLHIKPTLEYRENFGQESSFLIYRSIRYRFVKEISLDISYHFV